MPLNERLHFDALPDLLQCIKPCEHTMGRGTFRIRPKRLALPAADKSHREAFVKTEFANRSVLPDLGIAEG